MSRTVYVRVNYFLGLLLGGLLASWFEFSGWEVVLFVFVALLVTLLIDGISTLLIKKFDKKAGVRDDN